MKQTMARPPLLCRLRFHRWYFSHGSHNRYYSCQRCGARTVEAGQWGYQPVDSDWLLFRKPSPNKPGQSPPRGGWGGVIVWPNGWIQN